MLCKYSITDYLNDKSLPKGANKYNVYFMRKAKEAMHQYNIDLAFLYALKNRDIDSHLNGIFSSMMRQKGLWKAVCAEFKNKQISEKYVSTIKNSIVQVEERGRYVYNIIKDILYTTEYYPYFEKYGFEEVQNLNFGWDNSFDEQFDEIFKKCEDFMNENPEIIQAHMEMTAEDRESYEAYHKAVEEKTKKEKQEEKERKKAEKAEIKEIKENNRKHQVYLNRVNRSFEKYWS